MATDKKHRRERTPPGKKTQSTVPPRLAKKMAGKSSGKAVNRIRNMRIGPVFIIYLIIWIGLFTSVVWSGESVSGLADVEVHGIDPQLWDPSVIYETVDGEPLVSGTAYNFQIYSDDVPHGFKITELGIKTDTILAGQSASLSITFPSPGNYTFTCNVFCGTGHYEMEGTIIVT